MFRVLAISRTTLLLTALVFLKKTDSLLSPCEDYLLQRIISPAPRVIHDAESPKYKTVVQTALADPNINSQVKVFRVEEFISQSVRGYHYSANFTGSFYNATYGYCYFEWIMVPFVPDMPVSVVDANCVFDTPPGTKVVKVEPTGNERGDYEEGEEEESKEEEDYET